MWNVSLPACRRIVSSRCLTSMLVLTAACTLAMAAQAAPLTTTTLTVSSSSVASPAKVTLTASVTAGGAPVTTGSVTFCDVTGLYPRCEDSAVVGRAQLNGATATFSFIPAIGSHKYTAMFNGTTAAAPSTSSAQSLTVTGLYPTSTAIAATGNPSGYGLTATVVGYANHPPLLAGTVSFQDTSDGDFVLGTAPLGTPAVAETFTQANKSPILIGNEPAAVGTGDFNGDGKPDLAIMITQQEAIAILLGNGDGTFTQGATIDNVGSTPCIPYPLNQRSNCSVAVGDFNHDGNADLVATSDFDNTVIVLLGHGDGTFTPASGSPMTVGNFPQTVKVGDFNSDGLQDLVVANGKDNTVSILLGNGDGTFKAANGSPVQVGGFPFFLAVADFNGDGSADVAVTNADDSTVSVLLGNGDGTFTRPPVRRLPGSTTIPSRSPLPILTGTASPIWP